MSYCSNTLVSFNKIKEDEPSGNSNQILLFVLVVKFEKYTFILIILPRLKRFKLFSKASTLLEQVLEVTEMWVKYVRRFQYTSTATTTICQRLSVSPSWCSNSWNDSNKPPLLLFFWNVFTARWRGAYRWHSQVVDTLASKHLNFHPMEVEFPRVLCPSRDTCWRSAATHATVRDDVKPRHAAHTQGAHTGYSNEKMVRNDQKLDEIRLSRVQSRAGRCEIDEGVGTGGRRMEGGCGVPVAHTHMKECMGNFKLSPKCTKMQ